MIDKLQNAKIYANKFRYVGDVLDDNYKINSEIYHEIISNLSHQNLEISPQITPSLSNSLNRVSNRLKLPLDTNSAFIYPSEEIQATSLSTGFDQTILRFSSGLINLLDENEIEFIIGHELGHFLLNHGPHDHNGKEVNLQSFMKSRYQEISADRIGLIACESIDSAIRAMFKLISGLNAEHLRFDVTKFIGQINKPKYSYSEENIYSSHPSNLFRCRALLWFSLTDVITRGSNYYKKEDMKKLDQRIKKDLEDFIDGPILNKIKEAKKNYKLWIATENITKDGVFDKDEQAVFQNMFNKNVMDQLVVFLRGLSPLEINKVISKKIEDAKSEIQYLIPDTYKEEISKIVKEIRSCFN